MNLNQIYKKSDTKLTFADWLAVHRAQHMAIKKQFPHVGFEEFMNMKHNSGQLNADAEKTWLEDIISITKKTYDKYQGKDDIPAENEVTTGTPVKSGSSILGMTPMVAYSLAGVMVLTIGTIIYLQYKKQNEE